MRQTTNKLPAQGNDQLSKQFTLWWYDELAKMYALRNQRINPNQEVFFLSVGSTPALMYNIY